MTSVFGAAQDLPDDHLDYLQDGTEMSAGPAMQEMEYEPIASTSTGSHAKLGLDTQISKSYSPHTPTYDTPNSYYSNLSTNFPQSLFSTGADDTSRSSGSAPSSARPKSPALAQSGALYSHFADQLRQYQAAALHKRNEHIQHRSASHGQQKRSSEQQEQAAASSRNTSLFVIEGETGKESLTKVSSAGGDRAGLHLNLGMKDITDYVDNTTRINSLNGGFSTSSSDPYFYRTNVRFPTKLWEASDVSKEPGILMERQQAGLQAMESDYQAGVETVDSQPASLSFSTGGSIPMSTNFSQSSPTSSAFSDSEGKRDEFPGRGQASTHRRSATFSQWPLQHSLDVWNGKHGRDAGVNLSGSDQTASSRAKAGKGGKRSRNNVDSDQILVNPYHSFTAGFSSDNARGAEHFGFANASMPGAEFGYGSVVPGLSGLELGSGSSLCQLSQMTPHETSSQNSGTYSSARSVGLDANPSDESEAKIGIQSASTSDGKRLYQCKLCSRKFPRPSALVVHERIHSGEKPFACDVCGRPFTVASNLRRHQKIHVKQYRMDAEKEKGAGSEAASTLKPRKSSRPKRSIRTVNNAEDDDDDPDAFLDGDDDDDDDHTGTDTSNHLPSDESGDTNSNTLAKAKSEFRHKPIDLSREAISKWTRDIAESPP